MTESAQQTEVASEVSPSARPEQVREFDAKLIQVLPALNKEQMQHLIDHPEEMRARLRIGGLGNIESTFAAEFLRGYRDRNFLDRWSEFYAEEFQVDPDFSRIRLPDARVHTYVTPIRVATQIHIEDIIAVIQKHGIEMTNFKNGVPASLSLKKQLDVTIDAGRSTSNYVASFSTVISEKIPFTIRNTERYRATCMTLREHLLWIAYCLYCRDASGHFGRGAPDLTSCFGLYAACGSAAEGEIPLLNFEPGPFGAGCLDVYPSTFEEMAQRYLPVTIRRVKLFTALPQI